MRLQRGKIPESILSRWLAEDVQSDPVREIIVGPAPGEDTAVIDTRRATGSSDDYLVITSDPITFPVGDIGEYAITVSANDIATTGGVPQWFFATLLLPPEVDEGEAESLLRGLSTACRRQGVTLAGGHTEITDAVIRPVVAGTLIGTVPRERLVDKRSMAPGQSLLITKGVAVEGSSILASECSRPLLRAGLSAEVLEEASALIERIGIAEDARVACDAGRVVAMHDVTEGGVATAVAELGAFARLSVDLDAIPVLPVCREICDVLGINPLGLIGSGSLLIVCEIETEKSIINALAEREISCRRIGEVVAGSSGVEWTESGKPAKGLAFEVDEITRVDFDG